MASSDLKPLVSMSLVACMTLDYRMCDCVRARLQSMILLRGYTLTFWLSRSVQVSMPWRQQSPSQLTALSYAARDTGHLNLTNIAQSITANTNPFQNTHSIAWLWLANKRRRTQIPQYIPPTDIFVFIVDKVIIYFDSRVQICCLFADTRHWY